MCERLEKTREQQLSHKPVHVEHPESQRAAALVLVGRRASQGSCELEVQHGDGLQRCWES